ncbi:MAG: hypothetical protein WCO84_07020, partial [bacterium]
MAGNFTGDGFYRVTCPKYTAGVTIKDGKITGDGTAPMFHYLFGHPVDHLADTLILDPDVEV